MSWTGAMTALAANLTTAGATLATPITVIRAGMPETITQDQIAYWASGSRESLTGGNTLTKVNRERGVQVSATSAGRSGRLPPMRRWNCASSSSRGRC